MDAKTFNKFLKETQVKSFEVLNKKSYDYADDDLLSNFKRNSAIARMFRIDFSKDYHAALLMVLMKWDRLQNLMSQGRIPKNEGIEDTLIDGLNYSILMSACITEMLDEEKVKS